MGFNCSCEGNEYAQRSFLAREEKIELLKEYQERLEKETKGVAERIKELQKNS